MKPILNVLGADDHAHYKAHYCGICLATKGAFGRRATLGHSSELVFVSLLFEGLAEAPYAPGRAGCTALPPIPRKIAVPPPEHAGAIAAGLLATLQLDLADAREDRERRVKRFLCRGLDARVGPIDPAAAKDAPFVRAALGGRPADPVGEVVAGVIGSVFRLAGLDEPTVAIGCRIGHALGRLMNLSDALDDYWSDARSGRPNALRPAEGLPDAGAVACVLHDVLDDLDEQVGALPLRRNRELIAALINVHARARVEAAVARFRERAAAPPGPPVLVGADLAP